MSNRLKREGGLLYTDRPKMNTHKIKYQTSSEQSSPNIKELLGFLLLRLIAGQAKPDDWQLFDGLLRRYYSASGVGFHGLQSTNSGERVSSEQ